MAAYVVPDSGEARHPVLPSSVGRPYSRALPDGSGRWSEHVEDGQQDQGQGDQYGQRVQAAKAVGEELEKSWRRKETLD